MVRSFWVGISSPKNANLIKKQKHPQFVSTARLLKTDIWGLPKSTTLNFGGCRPRGVQGHFEGLSEKGRSCSFGQLNFPNQIYGWLWPKKNSVEAQYETPENWRFGRNNYETWARRWPGASMDLCWNTKLLVWFILAQISWQILVKQFDMAIWSWVILMTCGHLILWVHSSC